MFVLTFQSVVEDFWNKCEVRIFLWQIFMEKLALKFFSIVFVDEVFCVRKKLAL